MSISTRRLRSFICHSSGDKEKVHDLYERLLADGFAPWLDQEHLLPGQDWRQKINAAVHSSDVVIVCLSQASINKAGFVQKEIKLALDAADEQPEDSIFIIPLKLEECDVPARLSRWHWVNLFEKGGYERLISALQHRSKSLGIGPVVTTRDQTARRLWLIAGCASILFISVILAVRSALPHWFAWAVKPVTQKPQSPEYLELSKIATPPDLDLKQTLNGHNGIVWSVAFSPKSDLAASASEDKTILIWDTHTWTPRSPPLTGHMGEIYSIAFSPDGNTLASSSSDKTIKLWHVQTGELTETLRGVSTEPVLRLAFSRDGTRLASCSGYPPKGCEEIRLWDASDHWKSRILSGDTRAIFAIAFSPDGSKLVTAGFDKKLRLWDLRNEKQTEVLTIEQPLTTLVFSYEGKYMACGSNDGTIRLYQPQMQNWQNQPALLKAHENLITSIAFSPDNKTLVSASTDKTIRLWDVNTRTSTRLSASQDNAPASQRSVAFSSDGRTLMTGGEDQKVRVWQ